MEIACDQSSSKASAARSLSSDELISGQGTWRTEGVSARGPTPSRRSTGQRRNLIPRTRRRAWVRLGFLRPMAFCGEMGDESGIEISSFNLSRRIYALDLRANYMSGSYHIPSSSCEQVSELGTRHILTFKRFPCGTTYQVMKSPADVYKTTPSFKSQDAHEWSCSFP
nr:hypothetical protein CFP56_67571 [Quercus suber]